ncbi:MAG: branched-chain amino acid ABC transporter permease [Pseudomonadota bacterium]|nr:branched-chain amino acid ABC transporter permease [Pseudomonadota bacterium]
MALGLAALAFVLIWLGSAPLVYLVTIIMIWAIATTGLDLVFSVTGILVLGHGALLAAGAYAFAILTMDFGMAGLPALLLACVAGALLGALMGAPSLRLSGLHMALATLAVSQIFFVLITVKLRGITGGTDGLPGVPRPELPLVDIYDDRIFGVFVVLMFLLALVVYARLRESPFGQILKGIRQNEMRVRQLGADVRLYKLASFAVSGAFAGLAGALLSGQSYIVGPEIATWMVSGELVIMIVLGGRGVFIGPVVGVAIFMLLKEVVSHHTPYWGGILGIVFILITLFMPGGLTGLFGGLFRRPTKARPAGEGRAAS